MFGREGPTLGLEMVGASTSSAHIGIRSLSFSLALALSFFAAFSFAAACFACTFSTSLFRHCCNLLLEGFELCDGALHGGQVRCVVIDEAGVCLAPLLVSDPEATLFSSKYAPGSLTLPPGVTMPRGLAAAPARNILSGVVGLEDQRVMG